MTKQEQINEMARELCGKSKFINGEYACGMLNLKCDCNCNYGVYAERSINAGYRKIIWHKVADGDLPKRDSKDICAVPVQAHYIDSNGIEGNEPLYFFFMDNTFHSLGYPNAVNVIAWAELPKYKEKNND